MILGITGASGFVGRHVETEGRQRGDTVIRFSRHPQSGDRLFHSSITPMLSGCEGVVHLAGESILGLWTSSKRQKILESRLQGTRRLVEGIANASVKPRVLVSASAIGYYGDRGESLLDESSSRGEGFLADVANAWEKEALQAERYGVRVVCLRFGLVLGQGGGFLQKALTAFRYGLGAELGSGAQWMSCIHVEDLAQMIIWCLQEERVSGVINAVMPTPITHANFTQTLAQAVHRRAILKIPAWLLRLVLGEFSHLFLDSQRVLPKRALEEKFPFHYPTVEKALMSEVFIKS
jgi:uncharacterized protein (TIGR01777 family)